MPNLRQTLESISEPGKIAEMRLTVAALAIGVIALLTAVAGAAPAAADLQVDIAVSEGTVATVGVRGDKIVANGGTVTIHGQNMVAGPILNLISGDAVSGQVRFELPEGLRWGASAPDPTKACTSTPSTAICQSPGGALQPISMRNHWDWGWDVVAEHTGTYVLRTQILETSPPDVEHANDSSSVTVVVVPAGGGGGGGASVSASAVTLNPTRPRAGSTVRATVRVALAGAPVRPSATSCKGTIGASRINGRGSARSGTAVCAYRTPSTAKGKTLRGAVSFRVQGTSVTRRFAIRLG